jgi:hypothetical protein
MYAVLAAIMVPIVLGYGGYWVLLWGLVCGAVWGCSRLLQARRRRL